MPDQIELRGADDVKSTLVPKDLPEETRTSNMKKHAMVAVAFGIILVIVVAVVIVVSIKGPGKDCLDGALWMDNPMKQPFSVTLTTDTAGSVAVKGQLELCGQEAECCTTDKFVFEAPTLIHLEEHDNCRKFVLNKKQGMSIKVLNDDPDNLQIERIVMILEDGASFHGSTTESLAQSTWSQNIPLRVFNLIQNTMMKVNFRRDEENTEETSSIDGARIEMKRRGDSVSGCLSNPLPSNPLPGKNKGSFDLDDLETLGTCFGNSIKGAGDSLMIRFRPPPCMSYTVTKITLKSNEELTSGWWVKLKQQDDGWISATFDDDFIG